MSAYASVILHDCDKCAEKASFWDGHAKKYASDSKRHAEQAVVEQSKKSRELSEVCAELSETYASEYERYAVACQCEKDKEREVRDE